MGKPYLLDLKSKKVKLAASCYLTTWLELGDESAAVAPLPADYCGSCYGSEPTPGNGFFFPIILIILGYCCNTCAEVQENYRKKGWAFGNADEIEQVS
jgi:hypothetical protein